MSHGRQVLRGALTCPRCGVRTSKASPASFDGFKAVQRPLARDRRGELRCVIGPTARARPR